MPEEINRLLTDQISDLLFTPSSDANDNLKREGIAADKIFLVGNVMIDTLVEMLPIARKMAETATPSRFALVTLHRAGNVDDVPWLINMLRSLATLSEEIDILFPLHPRTRQAILHADGFVARAPRLRLLDPLPYLEFLGLQTKASLVITDSGGIQEETTFLGIPCLTVRENTERPITVWSGTNTLVGRDPARLMEEVERVLNGEYKVCEEIERWDGRAADRIAAVVCSKLLRHEPRSNSCQLNLQRDPARHATL